MMPFSKSIEDTSHTGGRLEIVVNEDDRRFIATTQPSGGGWYIGLTDDEVVKLVEVLTETMDRDTIVRSVRAMVEVMREMD